MKTLIKCVNELIQFNNSQLEETSYSIYEDKLSSIIKKSKINMIDDDITPKELGTLLITMDELASGELIETLAMLRQMESYESEVEAMGGLKVEDKYRLEILDRIANLINAIDECCRESIALMLMVRGYIMSEFQFE